MSPLMSTKQRLLSPPECVRGMTRLDKKLFDKTISVPFVEVEVQQMESAINCLKPFLLKLKNFNPIEEKSEENKRIIILNPELISQFDDIIKENTKSKDVLDLCQINELKFKDIVITYDNYTHKEILDSVLSRDGESVDSVSSFSTIGHILHLNLREHNLPFKEVIGQVLLDKVPVAHMVVNKLKTIDSTYRNFEMEVLAKQSEEVNTIVKIKECFTDFEFDFAKVYWNQRLGTEHERIQLKLNKGIDVLYDVFAGVGPFAIPAAKRRKCEVLANDLNPECYKWLEHNRKLNKVEDRIKVYNMDGRHFIKTVVKEDLINRMNNFDGIEMSRRYHVVMNLPQLAIEFLDAFKGLLTSCQSIDNRIIPVIHCYCFVKNEPKDGTLVVRKMTEEVLEHNLSDVLEIVNIRKVAPNKDMFRISFLMPEEVLYPKVDCIKRQRIQ